MVHKDKRRTIYDWANGIFKSIKTVYVHDTIPIGDHHHNNKDEHFMLVHGKILELQIDEGTLYNLNAPYVVLINRGTYHKFVCEPGSILVCGATEKFDPNDEIRKDA